MTVAAFELRGIDVVGNATFEFSGIGSEGRDENNIVNVVTCSSFGSDLKKDVMYNDCTKRGDIKNVKEETLRAVTVGAVTVGAVTVVLRKENLRELKTV